ncbi:uncharacterized protein LOC113004034 [Solenopsis invicta]|uniref:uncharacterized protein LOC113004034 n=1 Tax=Solenopsis invicta TaxID=13686 RepID=UPI00193E9525|nr:uncharacterized protein LOC113004034 [Solenopsis invicta]
MKLADDAQQHLAALKSLGVTVGSEMVVYLLESKLPRHTMDKWEALIEKDEFPTLEQMCDFLYRTAVCASRREKPRLCESERNKDAPPAKKARVSPSTRAFVVNASRNCIVCKDKKHPLYLCHKFKQMSVPDRIETVKNAKICFNCLRFHKGIPCKFSNCTVCKRRHNTLLHLEKLTDKSDGTNTEVSQSK